MKVIPHLQTFWEGPVAGLLRDLQTTPQGLARKGSSPCLLLYGMAAEFVKYLFYRNHRG